jgi:hypothetical protein
MTQLELQAHPGWQDLTSIVDRLDSAALIREHLEACAYRVSGYWDDRDNYYEEINLPSTLTADLVSSAIGFSNKERFLQLKFSLNAAVDRLSSQQHKIGELVLIYNENLEFIDESWVLDIDSPALSI